MNGRAYRVRSRIAVAEYVSISNRSIRRRGNGPTGISGSVSAILTGPAHLCRPRCESSPCTRRIPSPPLDIALYSDRNQVRNEPRESGSQWTRRWRERDSNFSYRRHKATTRALKELWGKSPNECLERTGESGIGASCSVPRVPANVFLMNPKPTLSLGGGNASSCPRLCENSCVQFARRKFFSFGQSENQKFWRRLFEEANRENCSTLSWLAHVFTRPGPTPAITRTWLKPSGGKRTPFNLKAAAIR